MTLGGGGQAGTLSPGTESSVTSSSQVGATSLGAGSPARLTHSRHGPHVSCWSSEAAFVHQSLWPTPKNLP